MSSRRRRRRRRSDDGEEEAQVESLVEGRAKRATAGNRLSSLLEGGGDDDLELLFAEDEEDEDIEFEDDDEDASDAQLGSSSDEEDGDPGKADDELAGEKELQQKDNFDRQKKRKAQDVFKRPGILRKKVKIDPSAIPTTPAPRQKKKSETRSWVPTEADIPTRFSSRKQTVQNREVVHQRLVDSEQVRIKVMQQMEIAQRRKEALKPKPLTQADRMEEAARVERKNAKSLNRWQESEKKRSEEQKAKLEALHNRQLTGPVLSLWSGLARWVNGKIRQLGVKEIRDTGHVEKEIGIDDTKGVKRANKSTTIYKDEETEFAKSIETNRVAEITRQPDQQLEQQCSIPRPITFAPPQGHYGFLDGIHAYAALPMQQQQAEFTGTADSDSVPPLDIASNLYLIKPPEQKPTMVSPENVLTPEIEITGRTLVALRNIDANTSKLPELQNHVLLKKRSGKLQSG